MFQFLKKPKTRPKIDLSEVEPRGELGDYPAQHLFEVMEKQKKHIQDNHEQAGGHPVGLDSEH